MTCSVDHHTQDDCSFASVADASVAGTAVLYLRFLNTSRVCLHDVSHLAEELPFRVCLYHCCIRKLMEIVVITGCHFTPFLDKNDVDSTKVRSDNCRSALDGEEF